MTKRSGDPKNTILPQLFRRSEIAYSVFDVTKAVGPIIDMVFVSRFFGANGVAALGYAVPLILLFELIGTCVGTGTRTKGATLLGEGKLDEANKAFSSSVISGECLTIAAALIVAALNMQVAFLLGAREPELRHMTALYLSGYLFGVPFSCLTRVITPYLQMEGQFRLISIAGILTTIIDVAADGIAIFLLHGGMFEIGLATSFGHIIPSIMCFSFFIRKKKSSVFCFSFKNFDPRMSLEMVRLGAPSGIRKGFGTIGGMLINNMLTALNMKYLVAAYSVFSQITVFIRFSWYGPADTLHAFASLFIGEEDKKSIKQVQKIAVEHSLIATATLTSLLFVFAPVLASTLFKSDAPQAVMMTIDCIRISSISLVFCSVVYNFNYYLISAGRLAFSTLYGFLIECGAMVPITFLSLHMFGYRGAWIARSITMICLCIIAILYICLNKTGKSFRDKMLLLPEDFGVLPEDELYETATSIEEIQDISKIAIAFALEHEGNVTVRQSEAFAPEQLQARKKRAMQYGLIVEELAGILAEHGFSDEKQHSINIRLVAKNDTLIIRMCDDCRPFDMTEYYHMVMESRNPEKDTGFAIIMKLARDVKYSSEFGTNNLLIRL